MKFAAPQCSRSEVNLQLLNTNCQKGASIYEVPFWSYKSGETRTEIEDKNFVGTSVPNLVYLINKLKSCVEDTGNGWVLLENGIVEKEYSGTERELVEGAYYYLLYNGDNYYYEYGRGEDGLKWYVIGTHNSEINFFEVGENFQDVITSRWKAGAVPSSAGSMKDNGIRIAPTILYDEPMGGADFVSVGDIHYFYVDENSRSGLPSSETGWYYQNWKTSAFDPVFETEYGSSLVTLDWKEYRKNIILGEVDS